MNLLSELKEQIYSLCPLHPLHIVNLLCECSTQLMQYAVNAVETVDAVNTVNAVDSGHSECGGHSRYSGHSECSECSECSTCSECSRCSEHSECSEHSKIVAVPPGPCWLTKPDNNVI